MSKINPDHHKSLIVFNLTVQRSSPTTNQIKCD